MAGQAGAAVGAVPMRFDALCATDKVAQRRYRQEYQQDESKERRFPGKMVGEGFAAIMPDPPAERQAAETKGDIGVKRCGTFQRAEVRDEEDVGDNPDESEGFMLDGGHTKSPARGGAVKCTLYLSRFSTAARSSRSSRSVASIFSRLKASISSPCTIS